MLEEDIGYWVEISPKILNLNRYEQFRSRKSRAVSKKLRAKHAIKNDGSSQYERRIREFDPRTCIKVFLYLHNSYTSTSALQSVNISSLIRQSITDALSPFIYVPGNRGGLEPSVSSMTMRSVTVSSTYQLPGDPGQEEQQPVGMLKQISHISVASNTNTSANVQRKITTSTDLLDEGDANKLSADNLLRWTKNTINSGGMITPTGDNNVTGKSRTSKHKIQFSFGAESVDTINTAITEESNLNANGNAMTNVDYDPNENDMFEASEPQLKQGISITLTGISLANKIASTENDTPGPEQDTPVTIDMNGIPSINAITTVNGGNGDFINTTINGGRNDTGRTLTITKDENEIVYDPAASPTGTETGVMITYANIASNTNTGTYRSDKDDKDHKENKEDKENENKNQTKQVPVNTENYKNAKRMSSHHKDAQPSQLQSDKEIHEKDQAKQIITKQDEQLLAAVHLGNANINETVTATVTATATENEDDDDERDLIEPMPTDRESVSPAPANLELLDIDQMENINTTKGKNGRGTDEQDFYNKLSIKNIQSNNGKGKKRVRFGDGPSDLPPTTSLRSNYSSRSVNSTRSEEADIARKQMQQLKPGTLSVTNINEKGNRESKRIMEKYRRKSSLDKGIQDVKNLVGLFDRAAKEVFTLLANDSFRRFRRTKECEKLFSRDLKVD